MTTLSATLEGAINQLRALQASLASLGSSANTAGLNASAEQFAAALQQQVSALAAQSAGTSTASTAQTAATTTATTAASSSASTAQAGTQATPVWRRGAENASQYLLPANADLSANRAKQPNVAQFMAKTGADSETAIGALYGAVAGAKDYRNWDAILASSDPLNATRQANAALYNSDLPYQPAEGFYPNASELQARAGNYAWVKETNGYSRLWIMDSKGMAVSPMTFDAAYILRTSRDYGLDTSKLKDLAQQLDAKGIKYKPGEYLPGSTGGVDLAALANGQTGTAFDWRVDPLAAQKGLGAVERLLSNIQLAADAGIAAVSAVRSGSSATVTPTVTGSTATTSGGNGVSLAGLISQTATRS